MVNRFDLSTAEQSRLRMLADTLSLKHVNCIRLTHANSSEHELKKIQICFKLFNNRHNFVCETSFKEGGKADVYDLSENVCYEVINSESKASIEAKRKKYPCPINVIECDKNEEKAVSLRKEALC